MACDYDDMNKQADIDYYKVFANDNIIRENKEANDGPLNNFGENAGRRNEKWFPGNKSDFREKGEERKSRGKTSSF